MIITRYWLLTKVYIAIKMYVIDTKEIKVALVSLWPTPKSDTGYEILKKEETKRKKKAGRGRAGGGGPDAWCSRKF